MSEASKERYFTLKPSEILFFPCNLSSHYCKSSNHLICPVSAENEGLTQIVEGHTCWWPGKCFSHILNTCSLLYLPVHVGKGEKIGSLAKIKLRLSMTHGVFPSLNKLNKLIYYGNVIACHGEQQGGKCILLKILNVFSSWDLVGQPVDWHMDLFSCQMSQSVQEHLCEQICARVTMEK